MIVSTISRNLSINHLVWLSHVHNVSICTDPSKYIVDMVFIPK